MEEIGLWAGFVLTLMIYSYIIADNFLYRLAVYLFVGMTAGYVSVVTFESVLLPFFRVTLESDDPATLGFGLLPLLLVTLLLMKNAWLTGLARLGNLGLAVIIGVGAAVALVGALTGTLLPFTEATINAGEGEALEAGIVLIGVVSTLIYFSYVARRTPTGEIRRPGIIEAVSLVGQGFIVITLGAMYGAAILTTLALFSERLGALVAQF
jgi:hypothetical protein